LSAGLYRIMTWPATIALVAIAAAVAGACQTSDGHVVLRKLGLLEGTTSYTSLAFLRPQSLPEQLQSKRADVPVSFTIHNSGNTTRDYQWSMLLVHGAHTRRVAAGGLRIAAGHDARITRSAAISCIRGRVQIVIRLMRPTESIAAWTVCWTPGS
jgi:hypothetical protein